jgi:hypothetical protein
VERKGNRGRNKDYIRPRPFGIVVSVSLCYVGSKICGEPSFVEIERKGRELVLVFVGTRSCGEHVFIG